MRLPINHRLALALTAAAASLAGCAHITDGRAACPGCEVTAEPAAPAQQPPIMPTPKIVLPEPTPAPPGSGDTLPTNQQGYAYIETKSGRTRCQLNSQSVGCESQFENSPIVSGTRANSVSVDAAGTVHWTLGNLGDIPAVTLDYRTYSAAGWSIAADETGTRFTNDETGHGMFVALNGVESF